MPPNRETNIRKMNILLAFLYSICEYYVMRNPNLQKMWQELTSHEKQDMAEAAQSTVLYLSQVCNGHGRPGKAMLKHIANYLEISDPQKIDLSFKPSKPRKKNKAAA